MNARIYSLPHRIWRIIYPLLIFLGIQLAVSMAFGFATTFALVFQAMLSHTAALDDAQIRDVLLRMLGQNVMTTVLVSNALSLAVFIPMWMRTRKTLESCANNKPWLSALLTIGFFAGFNIVQMFIFSVTDVMKYFPSYDGVNEYLSGGSLLLQGLAVGVSAPVVEELVFRGIMMGRMKWLPLWASILIQGALFGVAHMNLFQGLYAFLAGVLLALLYAKYRSIILAILGHMAYNFISIVLGEFVTEDTTAVLVGILAAGAAAAIVCAVFLIKRKGAELSTAPEYLPTPEYLPAPEYYPAPTPGFAAAPESVARPTAEPVSETASLLNHPGDF